MNYGKKTKVAQQPNENRAEKKNRISKSSLILKEGNIANDIPQLEKPMLNSRDDLYICVHGNAQINIHWDLSPQKVKLVSLYFNQPFPSFQKQLRIYHVTDVDFDGYNFFRFREWTIHDNEGSLIIDGLMPGYSYCVELGIILNGKKFFPIIRSNTQKIPGAALEMDERSEKQVEQGKSKPDWTKSVSTYTFYDNINDGWSI